jgi:hypothetical protein
MRKIPLTRRWDIWDTFLMGCSEITAGEYGLQLTCNLAICLKGLLRQHPALLTCHREPLIGHPARGILLPILFL